jgi:rubrerythrin
MQFNTVDDLLNFAIGEEEGAARFYTELADRMEKPWIKKLFADFAREELGHKAKLLGIREGRYLEPSKSQIMDLKIAEYVVDIEPQPGMDYTEALVLAMKKEKAAFRLYSDLAEAAADPDIRKTLTALAQEEAKHKLRFELEYDQHVHPDY